MPVVRVIHETLAAAHVDRVHGIVNGTTNFILTEMTRTGATYDEALAEAQRLGFAEADPTEDVSGRDAAAKMAILARLAFNAPVALDQVSYEGIECLTSYDIEYAKELGLSLKLVGRPSGSTAGIAVRVHPTFLYGAHPLASVHGSFNAVTIESAGDHRDHALGPRRGGSQTASAVLGDVVSAMIPPPTLPAPPVRRRRSSTDVVSAFYLHLEVADRPGVLAQVAERLGLQASRQVASSSKGLGDDARLEMVVHPVLESQVPGRGRDDREPRLPALAAARHPRHRGDVLGGPTAPTGRRWQVAGAVRGRVRVRLRL